MELENLEIYLTSMELSGQIWNSKLFLYFARGSLYETKTWLKKANERNLIDDQLYSELELMTINDHQ